MNRSIAFAMVLGLLAGCATRDPFGGQDHLNCRRVAELEALPTLQATVEQIQSCGVILKTEDGKSLTLAGPLGGDPIIKRFMKTLENGRTYTFPDAFLEFQKMEHSLNNRLDGTR